MRRIAMLVLVAACGGDDTTTPPRDSGPCVDPHDEDGDGFGDRCDICPAAKDPAQGDTTEEATMIAFADGVGDACDPRPQLSGDKLGAFHSFADPATAASWNGTGWAIENDVARATADARWVNRTREQGDGVLAQARLAQWSGAFEVTLDGNGTETGFVCAIALDRDGDGNDELDAREIGGAMTSVSIGKPLGGTITMTAWRIIDPQRRGEFRCRVNFTGTSPDMAGMASTEVATTDDLAIGLYGFAQSGGTTEVSSVVVYTSPTLPPEDL